MQPSQALLTKLLIYSNTQDEKAKENLEERHPYENFNKQVQKLFQIKRKTNFQFSVTVEINLSK